jgi:hypothetical protein
MSSRFMCGNFDRSSSAFAACGEPGGPNAP